MLISIQIKKKEEFLYSEIETALRNDLWKKKKKKKKKKKSLEFTFAD